MTAKLFYTVDEATEVTGIRRTLLNALVRRGEIPSRKLGRRRLFPVSALEQWAESRDAADDAVTGVPDGRVEARAQPFARR
jgi:excisionase family DNA binding protein